MTLEFEKFKNRNQTICFNERKWVVCASTLRNWLVISSLHSIRLLLNVYVWRIVLIMEWKERRDKKTKRMRQREREGKKHYCISFDIIIDNVEFWVQIHCIETGWLTKHQCMDVIYHTPIDCDSIFWLVSMLIVQPSTPWLN